MGMKSDLIRVDPDFKGLLKRIKVARVKKGIDKEFRSDRELTQMLQNCNSFKKVEAELSTTPTKDDYKILTEVLE